MNPFNFRNDSLDEIVFENRNKQYGAYVMRKSYDSNLLKASASSLGVFLLMGGVFYVVSLFKVELPKVVDPIRLTHVEQVIRDIEIILDPPVQPAVAAAASGQSLNYQIVRDNLVIPKPPTLEPTTVQTANAGNGSGALEGTAISGTGTESTIIEIPNSTGSQKQEFVDFVSDMPSFPGGAAQMQKYLADHINYPNLARENGIEGKVVVSFVVMEDGSINHIELIKGIGFGCEGEAIRVIETMPKWNAGKQNGKNKAVRMVIPIVFQMQ